MKVYNVLLVKRETSNASFRRDRLPVYERIGIETKILALA
jgi:hypothetical protein